MRARSHRRTALAAVSMAAVFAATGPQPAVAGGHGGGWHGAPIVIRPGMGFRGFGGSHGGWAGGGRARGLPPISGVIHEGRGMRPYTSAYGHTNTALRFGAPGWAGGALYGHTGTNLRYGGTSAAGWSGGALYGHTGTSLRYGEAGRGVVRRFGASDEGRRRLAGRRFLGGYGGGYGGFVGGDLYGGAGVYGDQGVYGQAGTYGGQGTYGQGGTYGSSGTYGQGGTYGGASYLSERPLAARFAEPPLAPRPDAPYSPDDRYAYAASEDVGPRVFDVGRGFRPGCGCGAAAAGPVVYRYGVGTAY